MKKHIVVIGGGMAGTAAANRLMALGYKVTIIEKNEYLGGRMRTHMVDGAAIEMGACFTTNFYTNLRAFLAENDLSSQLYASHSNPGMLRGGKVRMATLTTLAGNSALSWHAKRRLLALMVKHLARWNNIDHHAFWKAAKYDTRSISDALTGKDMEVLEYLLQPALNGYLYWMPQHTSEAMISNLIKTGLGWRRTYRMLGGLQRIPEQAAKSCSVLLNCSVTNVTTDANGMHKIAISRAGKLEVLSADGIVCATTATAVPHIFSLNEQQGRFFSAIQYSSTAVLARTYPQAQLVGNKSIAFPRKEGISLAAVTAWPEPGSNTPLACLKTYASGTIGGQLCAQSDAEITARLTKLMEPVRGDVFASQNATPIATHVQRWPEALPFFDVGHLKRLALFATGAIEKPDRTIVFAGDYLGGPYIEGAFTSGVQAAERLHDYMDA